MSSLKAISRVLSVIIVIMVAVIAAAFGGYSISSLNQRPVTTQTTTLTSVVTTSYSQTVVSIETVTQTSSIFQNPITVTQTLAGQNYTYSFAIWPSNPKATIENLSVITAETDRQQVVQFTVSIPSFLFVSPSFQYNINSNCSGLELDYSNGTIIPINENVSENILSTTNQVEGVIQILYGMCAL